MDSRASLALEGSLGCSPPHPQTPAPSGRGLPELGVLAVKFCDPHLALYVWPQLFDAKTEIRSNSPTPPLGKTLPETSTSVPSSRMGSLQRICVCHTRTIP